MLFSTQVEFVVELKLGLKLVTTSPGGWWVGGGWVVGGWTKTKVMLFSTKVEVVVELKLELSLPIHTHSHISNNIFKTKNKLGLNSAKFSSSLNRALLQLTFAEIN